MLIIGLTGSIATGKSETSKLFSRAHIPVFDADAEVHKIYENKSVVKMLAGYFPDAILNGEINRQILGKLVLTDAKKLKALEALIHPLVQAEREKFISRWKAKQVDFVIMDIPLLFETDQSDEVDYVIVVSATEQIQRERALSRAGMTDEKLAGILFRQVPDAEKRTRADFVIENSGSLPQLREQVDVLISKIVALSGKQDNERNRT
jgi:dephospho-CoA kinase